jgi:hypothetical protein
MNLKTISTDCYSFARGGPRASATLTHRPLPQPKTKAQQRSRQQRRRRVELGSNAARCPSHSHSSQRGWATTVDVPIQSPRRCRRAGSWGVRPSSSSLQARLHLLAPRSHRRRHSIPTDPPRATLQRSVRLLDRGDEDFRTRREIALIPRHVNNNGRIWRGQKIFFSPSL